MLSLTVSINCVTILNNYRVTELLLLAVWEGRLCSVSSIMAAKSWYERSKISGQRESLNRFNVPSDIISESTLKGISLTSKIHLLITFLFVFMSMLPLRGAWAIAFTGWFFLAVTEKNLQSAQTP